MRITSLIILLLLSGLWQPVRADEGMWIPALLGVLNEADMQSMGLKLTAEDIYSVNKSSLKDAIVRFGSGCTGEIISGDGLLMTNHHCGYGVVQSHSSVENDYLTDGFWAMNRSEELVNPSLTVTFIIRIEDVTSRILEGVTTETSESERNRLVATRSQAIIAEATQDNHYQAEVKPFYYGNEYFLIVSEVFQDVRLVGAPPSAIGKYGGDTDNWLWPRHTGDFSLFRVYSGPDGKPAPYSEDNIPLKPRHFFPISLKGVNANDFTMVYGFPYKTEEYLSSYGVELIQNVSDPIAISLREKRLNIIDAEMLKSDKVRIQYASKQARISNGYKKWLGRVRGLKRDNAIAKKQAYEAEFMEKVNSNPEWQERYGNILPEFEKLYEKIRPLERGIKYFEEGGYAPECVSFAAKINNFVNEAGPDPEGDQLNALKERLNKAGKGYFKNYSAYIDQQILAAMLEAYEMEVPGAQRPESIIQQVKSQFNGDYHAYAADLFSRSALTDHSRFEKMVKQVSGKNVDQDPLIELKDQLYNLYFSMKPAYDLIKSQIEGLNRSYMQAQRDVFSDKTFYPDANFSLRVAYGKVEGMSPSDGVIYKHYTTLDGIVAKYIPNDKEFHLPEKILQLHKDKDYGPYAQDGELRVCFIASNHTSGGNSGSPVINGEGHLIGLNFDRNWEGTMSDVNYDIRQCRNISVDVRYVLFIIDKYAGAGYLLEEMQLITGE